MHSQTWKGNFTHPMAKKQVTGGVLGKLENKFWIKKLIGYVTVLVLNKSFNIMVLLPLFVGAYRKYLGINILLVTYQTVLWPKLVLSLAVLDHGYINIQQFPLCSQIETNYNAPNNIQQLSLSRYQKSKIYKTEYLFQSPQTSILWC